MIPNNNNYHFNNSTNFNNNNANITTFSQHSMIANNNNNNYLKEEEEVEKDTFKNLPFDIQISCITIGNEVLRKSEIQNVSLKFIKDSNFDYQILSENQSQVIDNRVVRIFKNLNIGNDICKVKFMGKNILPFKSILYNGFNLNIFDNCKKETITKHFIPFGSSNSAKEESIMYFINKNIVGRVELTKYLGDFTKAIKEGGPVKFQSRLGLCFSTSKQGLFIDKESVVEMDDITNKNNGNITTDGIGYISMSAMREMFGRGGGNNSGDGSGCGVNNQSVTLANDEDIPSAIQIRYLGYKGVLMTLEDKYFTNNNNNNIKLKLYKSMKKFDGNSQHYSYIDILAKSEKMTASLNRTLITFLMELTTQKLMLENLFLEIFSNYLNELKEILNDRSKLFKLFKIYNEENLDLFSFNILGMLLAGQDIYNPYLLNRAFQKVKCQMFELLLKKGNDNKNEKMEKFKLKIPFPYACSLIGVVDPTGMIGPNEVYIPIDDNLPEYVLVTRHPCTLPNDIRKYKCLKRAPQGLQHLRNVIVFSNHFTKYGNSQADCMSGGDYDGDTYLVIYHDKIVNLVDLERDPLIITKPKTKNVNNSNNSGCGVTEEFFDKVIDVFINQSFDHTIEDSYSKLMKSIEMKGTEDVVTKEYAKLYSLSIDGLKNEFNLNENIYCEDLEETKWNLFCNNLKLPTKVEEYIPLMKELFNNIKERPRSYIYSKIGLKILNFMKSLEENKPQCTETIDPDLILGELTKEKLLLAAEFYSNYCNIFKNKNGKSSATIDLEVLELRKTYFGNSNEDKFKKMERASSFLQYMYLKYQETKEMRFICSPAVWQVCGDLLNELKIIKTNTNNILYNNYGYNFPMVNPTILKDVNKLL
ncbi:hypothetical protein ABK040_010956 [Willaertia magna]